VVIGEYLTETKAVFMTKALETKSELYLASDLVQEDYPCGLMGDYQFYNKKTVIQTLRVLQEKQLLTVSEEHIKSGFLKVIDNTNLQGRWQQLGANPKIICDTAHNAHGLTVVMEQLKKEKYHQLHIVLGVVNDKKLEDILILLPKNAQYYFCKPNIPRGLEANILEEKALPFGLKGAIYNSVSEAYENSRKNAVAEDFIYVGGSTFVVAEIL
jgi:dihydrofolate synthase/folylpolyglutamate synthase